MGFIFFFFNCVRQLHLEKTYFLGPKQQVSSLTYIFLKQAHCSIKYVFSSGPTETISLSIQSLLTVCNHQTLTFSIFFFYQSKKKEEKRSMLFFF